MEIITGYTGENHVTSMDDASLYRGIFGQGDYVLDVGNKFKATIIDNNTVRIMDGDLVIQGHQARIRANDYEEVTIDNGTPGQKRNDLIVARYQKNTTTGIESITLEVVKGTPGETATDPDIIQEDLSTGGTQRDFALYRVSLNGLALESVTSLFTVIPNLKDFMTHRAETMPHAEVTDKTITVGVGKDFATIQEAVDSLKKRIESNIIIQLDAGKYDETVYIEGFVGKGSVTLRGSSDKSGATNYKVRGTIYIRQNSISVTIEGLEIFTTNIGIAIGRNNYTHVNNCLSEIAGSYFIYDSRGGFVTVENCTASNKSEVAIQAEYTAILFSSNNDGTNNNIGLSARLGGTIIKRGTQPTGTTDEVTGTGGLIR